VQRALTILELVAAHPTGLTAKQVSLKIRLNLSTCYHLLNTLEHEGYLVKEPETLLFRVSGKLGYTVFGQATPAQLVRQLAPHVQTLQEISRETAYLSIWDGREITLSAIVEAPQTVRVKALVIGDVGANHASALGKAILAYFDEAALARYFAGRPWPAFTPHTVTTLPELKPHLHSVRQQGFSLDAEEFMPEVHCLGAPIFDARGSITASIAISVPVSRAERNRPVLIDKVKQVAAAASLTLKILGYATPAAHPEAGL
jgi:DNA-binding IclR family transcriptional regulator